MDDDKRRMRATMKQKYQGRVLKSGDEFIAETEQDVLDLEAARMAERSPTTVVEIAPPKRAYHRRDLKAQD
jgi:hypothetical protein